MQMTHGDCEKATVGKDQESNSTFEQNVLSDVKRQRPQSTVFYTEQQH